MFIALIAILITIVGVVSTIAGFHFKQVVTDYAGGYNG